MAKPDGRIEKGQRLASAISARAWNRAQDAADIVLGARPGISAESGAFGGDHVVIRIPNSVMSIATDPLEVGQGIGVGLSFSDTPTMTTEFPTIAQNESDLPNYSPHQNKPLIVPNFNTFRVGQRCGIIEEISSLTAQNEYICRVRVRGIVQCRVLMLTEGISVAPPPATKPTDQELAQYWRRYLLASDYGTGAILALGRYYRLRASGYPRIQEAIVML
jgi:hypothetical protein